MSKKKEKVGGKYLIPTEKVKGFLSSSQYSSLAKSSSPAVRKQLFALRKKESIKASTQLAKRKLEQAKFYNKNALIQQQIIRQQAAKRQRAMGILGSRAEQLEIQAVSFDEVPMLHNMERQRTRATTPPDKTLRRIEKEVTDSFPD